MKHLQLGERRAVYDQFGTVAITQVFARHDLLQVVLDEVHPANFAQHPPSPIDIAWKGEQLGISCSASELMVEKTIWRRGWTPAQVNDPTLWS